MEKSEWFASWFDTPYYHLLYKDRDLSEAQKFIHRLVEELKIPADATALDLACGKGRHACTLAQEGLNVLGVDLSEQSIRSAQKMEHDRLKFEVHDMREVIDNRSFDYIFNLFTSFGYFDDEQQNLSVFHGVHQMLQPNGTFVFDFLNLKTTLNNLVPSETIEIEGVKFSISKNFDGNQIVKTIDIDDQGKILQFQERVRGYSYEQLCNMMEQADFEIIQTYGNFHLHHFNENTADRVILISKRKNR